MHLFAKTIAPFTAFVFLASQCDAQAVGRGPGSQMPRPTVSPYLNLLNNGDPGIAYYGLVRPQIAFGKSIKNLEGEIDTLENNRGGPSQTGHSATFMTHSRYFMTNGAVAPPVSPMAQSIGGKRRR